MSSHRTRRISGGSAVRFIRWFCERRDRRDKMLWIVGKANVDAPGEWEFQGVFDSEEKAVAACATQRDGTVDMFVGPAKLNVSVTRRKRSWPGAYYPATQNKRRGR